MIDLDGYYVPTIEEFHIGFEYESTSPYFSDIYCEETMKNLQELYWETNSGHGMSWKAKDHYFDINSNIKNIRVKYLDKKDIESLGFEFNWGDETNYKKENITLYHDNYINPLIKEIWIDDELVFKGIVKNKSELKKVLKQLNINE